MIVRSLLTFALLGTLTACAGYTPKPYSYDDRKSFALNAAHAGGIYQGIRDTKAPEEWQGTFTGSAAHTGLSIAYIATSPIMGALSVFDSALKPTEQSARPSVFGWMPEDMAADKEEAVERIDDIMKKASHQGLAEMGAKLIPRTSSDEYITSYFIVGDLGECPERDPNLEYPLSDHECLLHIMHPHERYTYISSPPESLIQNSTIQSAYYFSASHGNYYPNINITPGTSKPPTLEIYAAISKNLPEWMFMYLHPGESHSGEGEPINVPMLLNKGQVHYFFTPE